MYTKDGYITSFVEVKQIQHYATANTQKTNAVGLYDVTYVICYVIYLTSLKLRISLLLSQNCTYDVFCRAHTYVNGNHHCSLLLVSWGNIVTAECIYNPTELLFPPRKLHVSVINYTAFNSLLLSF